MEKSAPFNPTIGTAVLAADGSKIGEVVAVHPAYVVVQKGIFLPDDLYVPRSAFAGAEGDDLLLRLTEDEVRRQDWDSPPPGTDPNDEAAVFPTGERVHLDVDEDAGG